MSWLSSFRSSSSSSSSASPPGRPRPSRSCLLQVDRDGLALCLAFLDTRERCAAARVCRTWRSAAATSLAWRWCKYALVKSDRLATPIAIHRVYRPLIRHFAAPSELQRCRQSTAVNEETAAMLSDFTGVDTLHVWDSSTLCSVLGLKPKPKLPGVSQPAAAAAVVHASHPMVRLKIDFVDEMAIGALAHPRMRQLKHITITNGVCPCGLLGHLAQLRSIRIQAAQDGFLATLQALPHIETLHIDHLHDREAQYSHPLPATLTSLTLLSVPLQPPLLALFATAASSSLQALTLKLRDPPAGSAEQTRVGLIRLVTQLGELHQLDLECLDRTGLALVRPTDSDDPASDLLHRSRSQLVPHAIQMHADAVCRLAMRRRAPEERWPAVLPGGGSHPLLQASWTRVTLSLYPVGLADAFSAALDHLAGSSHLTHLALVDCRIPDFPRLWTTLGTLAALTDLQLQYTNSPGPSVAPAGGGSGSSAVEEGITELRRCLHLSRVDLSGSGRDRADFGDQAASVFAGLPRLTHLKVHYSLLVRASTLELLAQSTSLEEVRCLEYHCPLDHLRRVMATTPKRAAATRAPRTIIRVYARNEWLNPPEPEPEPKPVQAAPAAAASSAKTTQQKKKSCCVQ